MSLFTRSADDLVKALLSLSQDNNVCILDSCGVGHLGSHLLIAGIEPVETFEITNDDPSETLALLDEKLNGDLAAIFTLSYDFGLRLLGLERPKKQKTTAAEPDVFVGLFNALIAHDYTSGQTKLIGNAEKFAAIEAKLHQTTVDELVTIDRNTGEQSNFTKSEYLAAIEAIKELIRDGDTYQTNLTQQLTVQLPHGPTPESAFSRLRRDHPAPFAAYIKRANSTVVSASPERFFRVSDSRTSSRIIETSPIKGTRRRGNTAIEDDELRNDLSLSAKDRAENTMIVDLLRNDLGRVCKFGSVSVDKLCELEEHPTLFHLVSTIRGDLREEIRFSDILRAVFPCGSITGAPKISTMKIIDEIETTPRGLSMGAIGYYVPHAWGFGHLTWDLSVAIRTMVIRNKVATFNVGGGITIDSDPEKEYDETLLKAKALLKALNAQTRA